MNDLSMNPYEYKKNFWLLTDDLINEPGHKYAVTVAFNHSTSSSSARRTIKHFTAKIDYSLHGKRWSKRSREQRVNGFLIPEWGRGAHKLHYHGIVSTTCSKHSRMEELWVDKWEKVVPSGTANIQPVIEYQGWRNYITKDFGHQAIDEYMVLPLCN